MTEIKRGIQLLPSMLCADLGHLREEIEQINASGVDLLHIDIMDGHFVPNMTGGADVANCIRRYSDAPCDFHLMVEDPTYLIETLAPQKGERVAFHIENAADPLATIAAIKKNGAQAGFAVCPGTPISKIEPYLDALDYLLILIVDPGFKGQPIIPRTLDKIGRLRTLIHERGLNVRLLADGAVTPENIIEIVESGADDLVCGPFTCFNKTLGGIGPTLALVKRILLENGYDSNLKRNGGAAP